MIKALADRYLNLVDPFYHFISERFIVAASNISTDFLTKKGSIDMGQSMLALDNNNEIGSKVCPCLHQEGKQVKARDIPCCPLIIHFSKDHAHSQSFSALLITSQHPHHISPALC